MSRRLAPLYVSLALLQLVPIWSVARVPTMDGPSHLYNAWLIRELAFGGDSVIPQFFEIDWRPQPNWIGHAVLAVLMLIVPPMVADKILVSAIVLLFLGAIWWYASAREYAFLAFPFTYHLLLQDGFYNFSISVALFFAILSVWWRSRDRPDASTIALVAGLLVLCWLSHPLSTVLAVASITVLWLFTLPGRSLRVHARHLIALLPVPPLVAWFVNQSGGGSFAVNPIAESLAYLGQMRILLTYDVRQLQFGAALSVLLIILILVTLAIERRRRPEDAFLIIALALLVLFLFTPDLVAGGQLLRERIALLLVLVPLSWFTPRLPRAAVVSLVVATSLAAVANAAFVLHWYRHYDRDITRFLRGASALGRDGAVVPLLRLEGAYIDVLRHAIAYAAIEKRLALLTNYEAETGYFPIRRVQSLRGRDTGALTAMADYVFTWRVPPNAREARQLDDRFTLISDDGKAGVYRKRTPAELPPMRWETVLLPLAGSTRAALWRVESTVRNTGPRTVRVIAGEQEIEIGPGATVPIVVSGRYALVDVERRDAGHLTFSTVVDRVDGDERQPVATVPSIRETQFRASRVLLPNVPVAPGMRLNLRVWTLDAGAPLQFRVRIHAANRPAGEKTFTIHTGRFFTHGDLSAEFGELAHYRGRVDVEVELLARARLWAFITATENATREVTVCLPD